MIPRLCSGIPLAARNIALPPGGTCAAGWHRRDHAGRLHAILVGNALHRQAAHGMADHIEALPTEFGCQGNGVASHLLAGVLAPQVARQSVIAAIDRVP